MDKVEENKHGFKFSPDDQAPPLANDDTDIRPVELDKPLFNWSAPDSFSVKKSIKWYLVLICCTIVLSAAVYFITRDKITTTVILVSGILLGIYGNKKPKLIEYQLTKYGFTINGHKYEFGNYRSFSIVHHGDSGSAILTPLKRFTPYMYIYFGSDLEQQITSTLTDVLPKETTHVNTIDRFLREIGF